MAIADEDDALEVVVRPAHRPRLGLAVAAGLCALVAIALLVALRDRAAPVDRGLRPIPVVAPIAEYIRLRDLESWDAATSYERSLAALAVNDASDHFGFVSLESFDVQQRAHEVAIFAHSETGMEFVLIPGGTFTKRSPTWVEEEWENEVTVIQPFLLARRLVRWRDWERAMGRGDGNPDDEVTNATSEEALAFCRATGLELPSSRQWEHACCAGREERSAYSRQRNVSGVGGRVLSVDGPDAMGLIGMDSAAPVWCWNDLSASGRDDELPIFSTASQHVRLVHRGIGLGPDGCGGVSLGEPPGLVERLLVGVRRIGVRPSRTLRVTHQ